MGRAWAWDAWILVLLRGGEIVLGGSQLQMIQAGAWHSRLVATGKARPEHGTKVRRRGERMGWTRPWPLHWLGSHKPEPEWRMRSNKVNIDCQPQPGSGAGAGPEEDWIRWSYDMADTDWPASSPHHDNVTTQIHTQIFWQPSKVKL